MSANPFQKEYYKILKHFQTIIFKMSSPQTFLGNYFIIHYFKKWYLYLTEILQVCFPFQKFLQVTATLRSVCQQQSTGQQI